MRLRVRGPAGQSTVTLEDLATVEDLHTVIAEKTGLTTYDAKYGYPDIKPLDLSIFAPGQKITDIGINLNGEQLIITKREDGANGGTQHQQEQQHIDIRVPPSQQPRKEHAQDSDDPPEIASPEHSGTFVLRIMPDDNSCLFRAVGSAVTGGMDTMNELRSVVAQTIQANPDVYSEAVLEKKTDDYCRWIQNENSWGGGIELSILSKHFDIEICSIDVQSLRTDRFNEGAPTRCIVVYSGIHYDTIALSPSDPPFTHAYAPPDFDTKIFDAADPVVLDKALDLCKVLNSKHYFTDTAGFRIRCNTCKGIFIGEKGAAQHATQTGHYDFGEAD
ncbi:hypothetical protein ASPZODRAFT_136194 [Penicilliopsis zonata CBS 506.65]|uniref:Ubiquitin thioesterase OTU n=1 Tax=Penicilliopsis zonata CBS 506.65 TaxID=1073090 RepID=A0A1L9S867_9EURO|nr:hypothetical protein ASPZODRAFT_136194 [Penicilliopsis zonata CBS 506.65]OJJ43349.1 hypothetical protein ASPZODRAFT_136194 [Penicilliopsis zonata CBS 506.65]